MTATFGIAYENLLDLDTAVVSATSAAASWPAEQVQSYVRALRWRSTAITDQDLTIAFGVSSAFDTVILDDINLTTAAVLTVKGSADGVTWTTVQAGEVEATPDPITGVLTANTYAVIACGDLVTYAYGKVTISDPTNANAYFEVGRVFFGVKYSTEYTHSYDWARVYCSTSTRQADDSGRSRTTVHAPFWRIPVQFDFIPSTVCEQFMTIREACDNWMPFWIFLARDFDAERRVYYVQFDDAETPFANTGHDQHNYPLTFRTVS